MPIKIIMGKTNWDFLEKEDDRSCEVINLNTKKQWKGFITSISSNGTYIVELKEEIKGK